MGERKKPGGMACNLTCTAMGIRKRKKGVIAKEAAPTIDHVTKIQQNSLEQVSISTGHSKRTSVRAHSPNKLPVAFVLSWQNKSTVHCMLDLHACTPADDLHPTPLKTNIKQSKRSSCQRSPTPPTGGSSSPTATYFFVDPLIAMPLYTGPSAWLLIHFSGSQGSFGCFASWCICNQECSKQLLFVRLPPCADAGHNPFASILGIKTL
eukprot:scaffold6775_cov19-Tisochrysis_lutea.AAC.9